MKTAAVIPAYHEEKHVGEVVRRTRQKLDDVLVVDDGSTDETAECAREAGAQVIVHEQNRGNGEAIKTGLRHWLERNFDFVIILDADGQHRPEARGNRPLRCCRSFGRSTETNSRKSDARSFVHAAH